tara:strand:- start:243 stop:470 length:228 start_codon:yes stop_codon:yes gene_type:complete
MNLRTKIRPKHDQLKKGSLHQGDCVHLINDEHLFQIIGIDNEHEKCWVRQWPMLPKGSPVFEIPIQEVALPSTKG